MPRQGDRAVTQHWRSQCTHIDEERAASAVRSLCQIEDLYDRLDTLAAVIRVMTDHNYAGVSALADGRKCDCDNYAVFQP
jgi:hypothetical protein